MARGSYPDERDWGQIGANVRQARIIRGDSQQQLAERAGVSVTTVYHVEQGQAISRRSLQKLAAGLYASVDSLINRTQNVLSESVPLMHHRAVSGLWTVEADPRSRIPEDNLARIQDPGERLRLGRLGLVHWFLSTTSFIMPGGPGHVFMELYGRFADALNPMIYRDATLTCVQGQALVCIAGETALMDKGDVVGYRSRDLQWIEPVPGSPLPVRVNWTGAVRVGSPPVNVGPGSRVKRRRASVG